MQKQDVKTINPLKSIPSRPLQTGLKTKIIRMVLIVGAIPLLFAVIFSYIQGSQSLISVIGASFKALAYETSTKIDLLLKNELIRLRHLSSHPTLILSVQQQNKTLDKMNENDRKLFLEEQTQIWNETHGDNPDAFLKRGVFGILQSFLKSSSQTNQFIKAFYISDLRGVLVGSVNNYPTYINSHIASHQPIISGSQKQHIGDLFFDTQTGHYLFEIATPILGLEKKPIGILHSFYSAKEFFASSMDRISFGETGHVMLIDSTGQVIQCPILPTGHQLSNRNLIASVTQPSANWAQTEGDGHGSKDLSIIGYSPLEETNKIISSSTGKSWFTFAWQSSEELFTPMQKLFWWASIAGIVSIILIATMGSYAADRIVRPIKQLQKTAVAIGQGKQVKPLKIKTGDEIEVLSEEINTMNSMLQRTFSGLEQKVEEKSKEVVYIKKYTENILMSVPEAILIFDIKGKIQYSNSAFENFFSPLLNGQKIESIEDLKQNFQSDWVRLEHEFRNYKQGKRDTNGKVSSNASMNYELKDPLAPQDENEIKRHSSVNLGNKVFTFQFFDVLLEDEDKHQIGLILKDITEEKKLLDQLMRADKLSGLGTLTAGIAHEMNNPLYSIIGYTEAISSEKNVDKIHKYSKKVLDRAKHMSSVILNMAGYSRSNEKDTEQDVDINERIDAAAEIAILASYSDDIKLEKFYSSLPPIKAKPEEIQQIFVNIIRNGVQAMEGKGKISIHSNHLNGSIEVKIKDSGPGIPQEYLTKVFDPFFTTKGQGSGTGLGLNIVHKMVEKYGGNIQVESTNGKGATFIITLPI